MRKCRNWQTSKTKDLVSIALVWVQVPSSALINKVGSLIIQGFLFFCLQPVLGYSWVTTFYCLRIEYFCKFFGIFCDIFCLVDITFLGRGNILMSCKCLQCILRNYHSFMKLRYRGTSDTMIAGWSAINDKSIFFIPHTI